MSSRLDTIRDWEERAKAQDYCVSKIAKSAGVSRQHLNRYFHARFNQSAQELIRHLRMEQAERLLSDGKLIKETASALGYGHATNFACAFRRVYGMSPRDARRSTKHVVRKFQNH